MPFQALFSYAGFVSFACHNKPIKIFITMASYLYEKVCEPTRQVRNVSNQWDQSLYEDIEDFQLTTNYAASRWGRAW